MISEKGLMLPPLLGVFCKGRNPDDGVVPDISEAGVPKSSRPPSSPVVSGESRQKASSKEHLGKNMSSSSKSSPPWSRGDTSQFTDASSRSPRFVEHVPASAPDGEDSQWMDARGGPASRSSLGIPSPAIARMPRGRHLRRSPTPGTTWWPAAKHAGVADPHAAAATSGEIDAWTGGVAPVDGVASASAFFSGVKASNRSSCGALAGQGFLPAAGPVSPIGSCPLLLGSCCPAHRSALVLDSWSGSRSGGLLALGLGSGRLGVRGVDAVRDRDRDPDAAEEGRRKPKQPGRSRAVEASLELRSESGLRRRLEPAGLGLGAVAGEGDGVGEGFRGLETE